MFFSQYFSFPLSVSFHHCSILIHSSTTHAVWCFSPSTSVFPCHYHSAIAPYSFILLPPTLYNVFLPVLQFFPVSIIQPLLRAHSFIYHPRCIMFFSQNLSFPLSVSFHHCSILIHSSTIHAVWCFSPSTSVFPWQYHSTIAPYSFILLPPTLYNVFLPVLQFSPVTIIPPLLHTHSFNYHPRCIMFFSQNFSFPLSVSFHHCSILIHSSTTHAVWCFSPSTSVFPCQYHSAISPYSFIHLPPTLYNVFLPVLQFSPVSIIPPLLHNHSSIYHPRCIMFFLAVLQFFPVSIIPPLLHAHSFIYHPRCIMFFSQNLSFPLSVSFHHCSILIHSSTTHAV